MGAQTIGRTRDFTTAAKWIAAYKTIRATVQRGRLYRIDPPKGDDSSSATMYVAQDGSQGVLFQMLHSSTWRDNPATQRPRGLDPARTYAVSMLGGGAYWMGMGLRAALKGDLVGAAFVFDAVK